MRLVVNPMSVLFHSQIDKKNGYHTIVFSWRSKTYIKVNPSGYWVLFEIDSHPGIEISKLAQKTHQKVSTVKRFAQQMIKEGIVAEYEV